MLLKAKAGLLAARKQLLEAKASRPQLQAALAGLKAQAAVTPPGPALQAIQAQIAKLEGLLASIAPGLAKVKAGLAQINAGQAKLAAAEAKLAAGAAQLATAETQLATAADALHTAKQQVVRARDYVRIIASGVNVGIVLAEARRDQATISSPISGTVTQAAVKGTVAMVGAPLVSIAPDDPPLVDTYVSGDRLGKVHVGTVADITFDSGGDKMVRATLETVASRAEYPPTGFPTDIVHMTRTVKLTFRIDSGEAPPAGTPVDIAIHTD